MLKLANERESLSIVADQIGAPTPAKLIADTTALCIRQAMSEKMSGDFSSDLYHLTTSGKTSWHGFAAEIFSTADLKLESKLKIKDITAIPTSDYPTPAKRPLNSRLLTGKLENKFNIVMPDWESELELCLEELRCKQ